MKRVMPEVLQCVENGNWLSLHAALPKAFKEEPEFFTCLMLYSASQGHLDTWVESIAQITPWRTGSKQWQARVNDFAWFYHAMTAFSTVYACIAPLRTLRPPRKMIITLYRSLLRQLLMFAARVNNPDVFLGDVEDLVRWTRHIELGIDLYTLAPSELYGLWEEEGAKKIILQFLRDLNSGMKFFTIEAETFKAFKSATEGLVIALAPFLAIHCVDVPLQYLPAGRVRDACAKLPREVDMTPEYRARAAQSMPVSVTSIMRHTYGYEGSCLHCGRTQIFHKHGNIRFQRCSGCNLGMYCSPE